MIELTNRLRRLVASLDDVKLRREERLFVAEGTKCVLDTLRHFRLRHLFATSAWIERHSAEIRAIEPVIAKRADMERMSHLTTPPEVIAVYELPDWDIDDLTPAGRLILALDSVRDPGNLGTIVRIADWFGIDSIVCSRDTVDVFNPKVIQATMGGISRVKVYYTDLAAFLAKCEMPVYGTFLDGENIFSAKLHGEGIIVMGNEGKGISPDVERLVTCRLTIPSFPPGAATGESLNVGMATAITVAEFRRRIIV